MWCSRHGAGCRNVDLAASVTVDGRFVIIEKWESPATQRAHFGSVETVDMADACQVCSFARRRSISSKASAPTISVGDSTKEGKKSQKSVVERLRVSC